MKASDAYVQDIRQFNYCEADSPVMVCSSAVDFMSSKE